MIMNKSSINNSNKYLNISIDITIEISSFINERFDSLIIFMSTYSFLVVNENIYTCLMELEYFQNGSSVEYCVLH